MFVKKSLVVVISGTLESNVTFFRGSHITVLPNDGSGNVGVVAKAGKRELEVIVLIGFAPYHSIKRGISLYRARTKLGNYQALVLCAYGVSVISEFFYLFGPEAVISSVPSGICVN